MSKNKELFDALNDLDTLQHKRESLRNNALDSLLALDPASTPEQFIAAVKSHKEFWGNGLIDAIEADTLDPEHATHSLKTIQRLAAEQRVKLGLKSVEQDTLVWILTHNTPEIRAYLATKKSNFGPLDKIPGWLASEPAPAPAVAAGISPAAASAPVNKSVDALPDASIDKIKKEANERLFFLLMTKVTDTHVLDELLNPAQRQAALSKLGYPANITFELTENIEQLIENKRTHMHVKAAKAGIDHYIEQLSEEQILNFKEALESDDTAQFNDQLDEAFKDKLGEEGLKQATAKVALRYIQSVVPEQDNLDTDLLAILNEADFDSFRAKLFDLPTLELLNEELLSKENVALVRKALLHGEILKAEANDLDSLLALDSPDPLAKVRDVLQNKFKLKLHDWIKDSDLKDIKQWARERAFMLLLEHESPYAPRQHKELIQGFKQLSGTLQRKILHDEKAIINLVRAQTPTAVGLLLGHEINNAKKIADENQLLAETRGLLYGIHNKEIARFLALHPGAFSVDQGRIDKVNDLLVQQDPVDPNNAPKLFKKLSEGSNYEDVCKKLIGLFDLENDDLSTLNKESVIKQQEKNEALINAYHALPPERNAQKRLITFLMYSDLKIDGNALKRIQVKLESSLTYEEFKSKLELEKDLSKPINDALLKEFHADLFSELKQEEMRINFDSPNKDLIKRAIKRSHDQVNELKSKFEVLTKNADKLEPLTKVSDIHLMNPAFQGQARDESSQQLKRFKELAHQSDLIVDQLHRMKAELLGMNNATPETHHDSSLDKSFRKLDQEIDEQIQQIDQRLEFYEVLQKKLHGDDTTVGVLQTLEDAAQGKKTFVHQFKEVACSVVNRSDLEGVLEDKKSGKEVYARTVVGSAEVIAGGNATALPWLLADKLSDDQVLVYDYKHTTAAKAEFRGIFTEEHKPNNPTEPEGKFAVRKFPTGRPSKELQDAQVKFSLALAVQSLASLDSLPTADKPIKLQGNDATQLRFLYAAFMSLGVEKKAVYVDSSAFNPEAEHGAVWGFNNNSAKVTLFDTRKSMVDEAAARLKQEQNRKNDTTGERKKVDEGVKSATQTYKQKTELLKEAQEKVDKDGPAPKV